MIMFASQDLQVRVTQLSWLVVGYDTNFQVEEEHLAFSPTDFLADCGGILGLFIGFNLVMIFDLIIFVISKFKIHF